VQISIGLPERASETGVLNHVKIYPLGVIFTYSGGIFNYAVVHFSTALMWVNKKQGVNFMLGSWQGVNRIKKFENPWSKKMQLLKEPAFYVNVN